MKFKNPTIQLLLSNYRGVWALMYANHLIHWDTETYMPVKGVNSRSRVLSDLNLAIQKQLLDKEFLSILSKAEEARDLNEAEKKVLHYLRKSVDQYLKLPPKFIEEWSQLIAKTSTIWAKARLKNDYFEFEPFLNKIFELTRVKAEYLGYQDEVYDAVFNEYEDGMTTKELLVYFNELQTFLGSLDLKGLNTGHDLSDYPYAKTEMLKLNQKVLRFLGHDPRRFRLDVSQHPFSLFLSPHDIRLTTRYPKRDFATSLLPTIHEFGHGLFASNVDQELEATPLWPDTSYALHESQSRYWENILGRSAGFVKYFYKDMQKLSPKFKDLTPQDFYDYFNRVKPGLIRVDADEITYHYHIIIRFEMERALLNQEITTKDAPRIWNELYQKYLGITPKNDTEGILQDIHWSFGSIGYFPTYSLGSTLAAIWDERVRSELKLDYTELTPKEIKDINAWFKKNIHVHGGMYNLEEIALKIGKKKFSSKSWQSYILQKLKQRL